MSIEQSVELFAIIHFGIGGVSHIAAPKAWARFFLLLRSKGEAGVIVVAFLSLGFGSVIVAFHRVWSGIPMILTVVGYLQLLKATIYLTYPAFGLRKLRIISMERAWFFVVGGIVLVTIAEYYREYHRHKNQDCGLLDLTDTLSVRPAFLCRTCHVIVRADYDECIDLAYALK